MLGCRRSSIQVRWTRSCASTTANIRTCTCGSRPRPTERSLNRSLRAGKRQCKHAAHGREVLIQRRRRIRNVLRQVEVRHELVLLDEAEERVRLPSSPTKLECDGLLLSLIQALACSTTRLIGRIAHLLQQEL